MTIEPMAHLELHRARLHAAERAATRRAAQGLWRRSSRERVLGDVAPEPRRPALRAPTRAQPC